MASLPTLSLGTSSGLSSTAIVGSEPVLEEIGSASDTSYIHDNTNSTHTGQADFALEDMPADFGTMATLSVNLRYLQSGLSNNTWDSLRARVYQSDGTTPLTDERTVASSITTTSATNSGALAFTGVSAGSKTLWNGAIVRLFWGVTRNKGGDSHSLRVTAAELTGTYNIAASFSEALTTVLGTGSVGSLGKQVRVALTGTSGTGAVETFGKTLVKAISGNVGTGAIESLIASYGYHADLSGVQAVALTGNQGSGIVGIGVVGYMVVGNNNTGNLTTSVEYRQSLIGNAGTGAIEPFGKIITRSISGNVGTGAVNSLAASIIRALSGNAGTGSINTFTKTITRSVSGNAGAGTVGDLRHGVGKSLSGNNATGSIGSVSASITRTLSGNQGTGSVGSLSKTIARAILGNQATGSVNTFGKSVTRSLSGNEATAAVGLLAARIAKALTGVLSTGELGTLTANGTVVIAISGVSGTGAVGDLIPSSAGGGQVVVIFGGVSSSGLTQHQGISKPTLILEDAGGGTYTVTKLYTQSDFKSDAVSREVYTIDGELP